MDSDENVDIRNKQRNILSHTVPGDIFVEYDTTTKHIVLILNINYPDNEQVITEYSQVDVIHSVQKLKNESEEKNCVRIGTWENIQNNVTNYKLRRLIHD